ncbi:Dephospho-CoA kinase cab5 [Cytospora paraplurivora]|uniref:Dephospho-CoA kinase cab5 n=1 Tax=Cytospora paraplurivora TaxID=2898453 RepID=A0AAN9U9K0_9PEZI
MLIIGLTGGIATGKSTVSSILSSPPHNLPIIDADVLARKVVEPGTSGYRAIVRHFGPTTPDLLLPASPDDDGHSKGKGGGGRPLNRAALGRRVFGDAPEARGDRAVLNSIVHPAVRREAYKALLWAYLRGHWAVVWDVPLLFEVGIDRFCGVVVVVSVADPEVQMGRLRARDPQLSAEEAGARVRSQMDVRVKARRCEARGEGRGVVVLNDGDKEELRRGVERALVEIRGRSPWWWSTALWLLPPLAVAAGAWNLFVNWRAARRWEEQEAVEKAKL